MTKKQFGIIFTLMALIVCVGVIAAKINKTGLNDPTDFSQVIAGQDTEEDKDKDKDKETLGSQDYFFTLRSEKEKEDAITLQNLDALIADANTSQEAKDLATNNRLEKTMLMDKESRIEVGIKNKGFEDVLCSIDGGNKVRILVSSDELTDVETASIQEIAENISGISDVIIEPKK
ncbi:SpoIIIAH-like family protein [Clostridium sartagoforme]|uniref:SpoIIIAH-like family protein n=1 Tax=Clostridium sartagoforme TaxID=84031 RepID=A0A4S2DTH8_9CLOT|nr:MULTISPECIES: SpoIIIAH-like family protein [Clostridium]MBS5938953.1 SpoIIIAH-like family protein [Clostridium sp.]TGY44341.1 SpoIIIAH-like family protein [Clostridium sartagoforme]